ncbi:hypothetical protein [Flavobacterium sp.]|jgi:hypothetical protein|uniref:hypothetical protein n=1 Tax=Flavobacterium sp. TaxID=239 RepID=UPI0037BFB2B3
MKNIFILIFILASSSVLCQNQFKSLPKLPSTFVNFSNNTYSLNFNYNKPSSLYRLSIYNPTTNLNDNYYLVGGKYYMSNTKSFSFFGPDGQRIDSFNPSGTNDFKSALIMGFINKIIKGF